MPYAPVMSAEELSGFLDEAFPQMHLDGRAYAILSVAPGAAQLRFTPAERHLRPGNTVSGPALFALADYASYAVVLAHLGPVALAVTTSLNMTFMRKPPLGPLLGSARILKLGRSLVVIETDIVPEGGADLVAHAVATFAIPPRQPGPAGA